MAKRDFASASSIGPRTYEHEFNTVRCVLSLDPAFATKSAKEQATAIAKQYLYCQAALASIRTTRRLARQSS
jgi:hypothetical protein